MSAATAHQQNISFVRTVRRDELPASCPRADDELSALHPRVYLAFTKDGTALCPYCGARYQLKE